MPEKEDWTWEEIERDYVATMTAVTIPVNLRMEGQTRILDLDEVEILLHEASVISIASCDCRAKMQKCQRPLDVCIGLDQEAETMITKGTAKQASRTEALEALQHSHEAGLVHIAYTNKGQDKPFVICSCCACCCHSLGGLIRFGIPEAVVAATYVATHNSSTCTVCGICTERCQFQARHLENGKLIYDTSKCFGCGVCVSTCPTNSIGLVPRLQHRSKK